MHRLRFYHLCDRCIHRKVSKHAAFVVLFIILILVLTVFVVKLLALILNVPT
jgi:hypothetical protein